MTLSGLYYEGIAKVTEADLDLANKLLSDGWKLLTIKEVSEVKPDGNVILARPLYILGLETEPKSEQPKPEQPAVKSEQKMQPEMPGIADLVGKIKWIQSGYGDKDSYYAWTTTKDAVKYPVPEEVTKLADAIRNAGGEIIYEGHKYRVSKDGRFLQKFVVKEQ
ncbi:MAG: hypothetical protein JRN26_04395 [Nitrososphaerota archaeon]|nr:hypothetical protein [Nitrososphaerota archaeon]MDG6932525.1 hypothetical protein [Nitrososphaerota archaeon]MDG6936104.1 hypothetical protein [Nitrososphaerota archaeon]MDG6944540.1 hypothetical protein [Nitrososphaerota archaeon]